MTSEALRSLTAPLLRTARCSAPNSMCSPLSLHISTNFPIPFVGSPASTHGHPGDALMRGTAEPLSFVDLLWGILEKLAPNMNNGKQFIATKCFLMSHDGALGEWGIQKTFANGINMWNPGDKWRFPLLCNRISLLNFNKAFQNTVNSPPNLLCCCNYSTITGGKITGTFLILLLS